MGKRPSLFLWTDFWRIHTRPTRQAGADVLHFCKSCSIIGGWIPPNDGEGEQVSDEDQLQLPFSRHVKRTQIRLIDISETVWTNILTNPDELLQLNPAQFEEFVFERLCAMGLSAHRVGKTFRKDGGIDIIFTPPKNVSISVPRCCPGKTSSRSATQGWPSTS
jgi:hypothetical protein